MRRFDLVEPTTLEQACDFIADNDGAKVIAGNLAHGDYQSDPPTVLIALDATVELLSRAQTRQRKSKKGSRRNVEFLGRILDYEIGKETTRAKHVLSKAEGTQSTPSDGRPLVIPNECEGSEKDFSLRSK